MQPKGKLAECGFGLMSKEDLAMENRLKVVCSQARAEVLL